MGECTLPQRSAIYLVGVLSTKWCSTLRNLLSLKCGFSDPSPNPTRLPVHSLSRVVFMYEHLSHQLGFVQWENITLGRVYPFSHFLLFLSRVAASHVQTSYRNLGEGFLLLNMLSLTCQDFLFLLAPELFSKLLAPLYWIDEVDIERVTCRFGPFPTHRRSWLRNTSKVCVLTFSHLCVKLDYRRGTLKLRLVVFWIFLNTSISCRVNFLVSNSNIDTNICLSPNSWCLN